MLKLKIMLKNGLYRIIHPVFPSSYNIKQLLSKTPTDLQFVERSVFMEGVNFQNFWTFELGTQEGIFTPMWIIVGFQQRDRQGSQNSNKDTFDGPPVTSAQCIIGTETYPDSRIFLIMMMMIILRNRVKLKKLSEL